MRKLTITELRKLACEKADGGLTGSAMGVTYAQAAERALEATPLEDVEQLARWWVREKLDSGSFVTNDWGGEAEDLPLGLGEENARRVVARAAELWSSVVFDAFCEGMRASRRRA